MDTATQLPVPGTMSGQATGWVLRHGPRDQTMRAVLVVIADAANRDGEHAHPGLPALMDGSLYSRSTVLSTLRKLRTLGWIEIEEAAAPGRSTVFRIPGVTVADWQPEQVQPRPDPLPGATGPTQTGPEQVQPRPDPSNGNGSNLDRQRVQSEPKRALVLNGLKATTCTQSASLLPAPEADEVNTPPHPYWDTNPATLKRLQAFAPPELIDGNLAEWCDKITDGTGVYWDHQMRKYLVWNEKQPPSRRHRNLRKGFIGWIQQELDYDQRRRTGAQRSR